MNIDLKLLVRWLHTNKIGLNVDKTETIFFRSANKKVDYDLKLKLNGKKLQLVSPVRYLGIVLDEICLLYTSPSPRDKRQSRMPSSA